MAVAVAASGREAPVYGGTVRNDRGVPAWFWRAWPRGSRRTGWCMAWTWSLPACMPVVSVGLGHAAVPGRGGSDENFRLKLLSGVWAVIRLRFLPA